MPIVDVYGQEGPGSEVVLDVTNGKYGPLVLDLLPNGLAWDREDPLLKKLCLAEAVELSRVDIRSKTLERELTPKETFELLEDWEKSYGLPECAATPTLALRRAALEAKLLQQAGHDHSMTWWTVLVDTLGFYLHYIDYGPTYFTCIDECDDPITDEAFVWTLAVDHTYDAEQEALLACFVDKNALLTSIALVHYMWTPQLIFGFSDFRGVATDTKGRTIVAGLAGKVFSAWPSLTSWTQITTGVPAGVDIRSVCAVDDYFVAVGASTLDAIWSSTGGLTWHSSTAFAGNTLNGVARGPLADLVCVAVGLGGQIWRSSDQGKNWATVASPTALQLTCVCNCEGAMLAGGLNGIVIRSTSNGAAPWSIIAIAGLGANVNAIAGLGQIVVLVTNGGFIYRSADTGLTWAKMTSPIVVNLYCVVGSPSGRWTAGGLGGVIVQSLDGGITWEQQISPVSVDLRAACFHHPDNFAILAGDLSALVTE